MDEHGCPGFREDALKSLKCSALMVRPSTVLALDLDSGGTVPLLRGRGAPNPEGRLENIAASTCAVDHLWTMNTLSQLLFTIPEHNYLQHLVWTCFLQSLVQECRWDASHSQFYYCIAGIWSSKRIGSGALSDRLTVTHTDQDV